METILISVLTIVLLIDIVLRIRTIKPKTMKKVEEENKKEQELAKAFDNLMKYDHETAMRKDK